MVSFCNYWFSYCYLLSVWNLIYFFVLLHLIECFNYCILYCAVWNFNILCTWYLISFQSCIVKQLIAIWTLNVNFFYSFYSYVRS
jgi:hypothetical protein